MARSTGRPIPAALLAELDHTYKRVFGETPLRQRLEDILKEALELSRYSDLKSLKDEASDLLGTLLQLFNEAEWSPSEAIRMNLDKISRRADQYQGLGRKVQVAILGGAFDPVTVGHLQVARFVLDASGIFDEVWLMPCRKHLYGKSMTSTEHRLNMLKLATESDGRLKVFDYEIKNKLDGETFHLAKLLQADEYYSDRYSFSFIIGMDNANSFHKWVNYQDLERMARFVVVPRTGEQRDRNVNWYLRPPHVFLEPETPLSDISSTKIREGIREQQTWTDGCVPEVAQYITDNRLYGLKKDEA